VGVCRPADGQVYMCAWVGMQAGMSADWGCHCHCCWCAVTVMSLLVPSSQSPLHHCCHCPHCHIATTACWRGHHIIIPGAPVIIAHLLLLPSPSRCCSVAVTIVSLLVLPSLSHFCWSHHCSHCCITATTTLAIAQHNASSPLVPLPPLLCHCSNVEGVGIKNQRCEKMKRMMYY
jgi:hypothetical protein